MRPGEGAAPGSRGDGGGRPWPVAAITLVSVIVVLGSVAAVVALFPHRIGRTLIHNRLFAVSVWNAFEHRCQLENSRGAVLSYTCGSDVNGEIIRAEGSPVRDLVIVGSPHDNCVVDVDTLEAVLCRDRWIEWALLEPGRLSIAILDPSGRGQIVVQQDLTSGETRELRLPHSIWRQRTEDAAVPIVFFDQQNTWLRLGWGELVPTDPLW